MVERKSSIPITSIYNQLNNLRCDIYNHVIVQMDWGLSIKGWAMIDDEVRSATYIFLEANCITDIMELL